MARHLYGLTGSDWTFVINVDGVTPNLASAVLTLWNAQSGGTQYTDLSLDAGGLTPITTVTSSDGTDGYLLGTIEGFYGPDGIRSMWVDGGSGRLLILCVDSGTDLDDHEARIEALENQVVNLLALTALMPVAVVESSGTYPARPAIAAGHVAFWIGDDTPTAGGTGMAEGDLDFDTAP